MITTNKISKKLQFGETANKSIICIWIPMSKLLWVLCYIIYLFINYIPVSIWHKYQEIRTPGNYIGFAEMVYKFPVKMMVLIFAVTSIYG